MKTSSVRDRGLWDRLVNDRFAGEQPVLSPEESAAAARKLYRHAMGKSFTGAIKLTSGNRFTWIRNGVMLVNPDNQRRSVRGLRSIVHDLSHYCHRRLHPHDAPHSVRQARLERDLARFAIDKGFLDGALLPKPKAPAKPEPQKPDAVQQRYARMVNRRDKWAAEMERAKRLHAKVAKEVRAYERRHGTRVAPA